MARLGAAILAGGALAALAPAQTNVTIGALKDTTIYSGDSSRANGGGPTMFTGQNGIGWRMRSLIAFDIAGSVPVGSTITRVQVRLVTNFSDTAGNVFLYRLLQDWGEGNSIPTAGGGNGAPAAAGDATWSQNFYLTSGWTTPGGTVAATQSAVSFKPALAMVNVIWDSQTNTQLLTDAQSMLANPTSNFGWELVSSTEGAPNPAPQRFATSENSDTLIRPQLFVTYTPVPEPSTLACLAAGGAALLRRARRRQAR
jgi:hypothetical protein